MRGSVAGRMGVQEGWGSTARLGSHTPGWQGSSCPVRLGRGPQDRGEEGASCPLRLPQGEDVWCLGWDGSPRSRTAINKTPTTDIYTPSLHDARGTEAH